MHHLSRARKRALRIHFDIQVNSHLKLISLRRTQIHFTGSLLLQILGICVVDDADDFHIGRSGRVKSAADAVPDGRRVAKVMPGEAFTNNYDLWRLCRIAFAEPAPGKQMHAQCAKISRAHRIDVRVGIFARLVYAAGHFDWARPSCYRSARGSPRCPQFVRRASGANGTLIAYKRLWTGHPRRTDRRRTGPR